MEDLPPRGAPVALYEGPRVTAFRGWSLVGLVVLCVLAGAGLRELLWRVDFRMHAPPPQGAGVVTPQGPVRARLSAPGKAEITLPPAQLTLVNVWLQGCPDCMASFEEWRSLRRAGAIRTPVVNVAYGSAVESWARTYAVDENMVFDDGSQLVQPLGISTFTSLLVDPDGMVRFRGSPSDPDFAVRLNAAIDAVRTGASSATPQ